MAELVAWSRLAAGRSAAVAMAAWNTPVDHRETTAEQKRPRESTAERHGAERACALPSLL